MFEIIWCYFNIIFSRTFVSRYNKVDDSDLLFDTYHDSRTLYRQIERLFFKNVATFIICYILIPYLHLILLIYFTRSSIRENFILLEIKSSNEPLCGFKDKLTVNTLNNVLSYTKDDQCGICMGDYDNEIDVRILTCGHYYHADCVTVWSDINNSCPKCKKQIVGNVIMAIE
jgi:hypothetical protein